MAYIKHHCPACRDWTHKFSTPGGEIRHTRNNKDSDRVMLEVKVTGLRLAKLRVLLAEIGTVKQCNRVRLVENTELVINRNVHERLCRPNNHVCLREDSAVLCNSLYVRG
jgi:hypothetical protein